MLTPSKYGGQAYARDPSTHPVCASLDDPLFAFGEKRVEEMFKTLLSFLRGARRETHVMRLYAFLL